MQTTRPLRGLRSFKVIDFGTKRKPICDFQLVINGNLRRILRRFRVIVALLVQFSLLIKEYLTLTPPRWGDPLRISGQTLPLQKREGLSYQVVKTAR